MNAPLTNIAYLLRRGRLDLAADNASQVSLERRRHARTVESDDAHVAAYEAAEYQRKFDQALSLVQEDAARDNRFAAHIVRITNERLEREAYELRRAAA